MALGLFPVDSCFRASVIKLTRRGEFDAAVIVLILISSLALCVEDPLSHPASTNNRFMDTVSLVITFIFLTECILKIIADGLILNGSGSYLRGPWNLLDFAIVILGLVQAVGISDE